MTFGLAIRRMRALHPPRLRSLLNADRPTTPHLLVQSPFSLAATLPANAPRRARRLHGPGAFPTLPAFLLR